EVTPLVAGHTETPVEFVPPDNLRPGQVGTLVDFTANPLDVTATIVDLAVRKQLVIEEVPTESKWLGHDWKLTKLKGAKDKLLPYEQELLDGLFREGDVVKLSDLKYEFSARMRNVQTSLAKDAKDRGWWTRDPSSMRVAAGCLGTAILIVGIGVTIALGLLTHVALIGIPIILLGLVMTATAYWAPARTAKGAAV